MTTNESDRPRTRTRFALALLAAACTLLVAGCAVNPPPAAAPADFDLKIANGRIMDGTGAPWFRGDIGVRGDTIVAIGDLSRKSAATTIDARDQIVSPGFIDLLGQSQSSVLVDPHLEPKVRQGVTTEVTGEGFSPGPIKVNPAGREIVRWETLGQYLDVIDKKGSAVNFALLVGASNPREIVIGETNRAPSPEELARMEGIVDQAMREGAIGVSTSLIYLPAMYSTTDELIALAKVAAKYDGVYFTHLRDEGEHIDPALDEAFRIGREAKIPVNIWHLKTSGVASWGKMPHVVERIEQARLDGIDVAANVYPYIASGTSLSTLAPDWAMEGGYRAFQARLADPEQRARIAEELRTAIAKRAHHGIFVGRIDNSALVQFQKQYLEEIAAGMNLPQEEALMRLFSETKNSPSVIFFSMNEDDVRTALRQPWVSYGSDSASPTPQARANNSSTHPRAYGTFPRVLGHYVRDEKLMTLEEAVRRATSQAAGRAHLDGRGLLKPGMKADIVVFDPEKIRDVATFADPHHLSEGVMDVVVNGIPVLRDGSMTDALPGKSIRGRGYVKQ